MPAKSRTNGTQRKTDFVKLYAIERKAREEELSEKAILSLRQKESVPILDLLKEWMIKEYASGVLPESKIGKAINYSLQRWDRLCIYTTNGKLQIDNNLVENDIRPMAVGRKNYMFAGSHQAAKHAAMMYSLFGTCKLHKINPFQWLHDVLKRIPTHPINKIEELLPTTGRSLLHLINNNLIFFNSPQDVLWG